jgi:kumamolisin
MNKYQMSYNTFVTLAETGNQFPQDAQISPFDPNTILSITVMVRRPLSDFGLTMREYADQIIANRATKLTRQEFSNNFSATEQDINQVLAFAEYFGMTVVESHADSATIKLSANVSILNSAFNIAIEQVIVNDQKYFGHSGPIGVPTELSEVVEHVLGLNSFTKPFKNGTVALKENTLTVEPNATPALSTITPIQAANAYKFPNFNGGDQCIGIIEYGGGYSKSNLDLSFSAVGLTTPEVVDVSVNNGANNQYNSQYPDALNYSAEVSADIFVAGCMVPRATIAVYFNNVAVFDAHFADPINIALHDTVNNPSVISISWSIAESLISAADVAAIDNVLAQSVILGKTICCSSGDNGAYGDKLTGTVSYPASSPYVLAVGGTSLILNADGTINSETAWSGSGGGLSRFAVTPVWQNNLNFTSYYPSVGNSAPTPVQSRAVPDVAANADVKSGYTFYSYYYNTSTRAQSLSEQIIYGGTSVSTPLIAGYIIKLNQIFGKPFGFVNPLFYANFDKFNDITTGNNSYQPNPNVVNVDNIGFSATTGWDAVTGIGSPNGALLIPSLRSVPYSDNIAVTVLENSTATILPIVSAAVNDIVVTRPPMYGTYVISKSPISITYTPNIGYFGPDSILFNISTPFATSNVALISITVSSLPPVANTFTVVVLANSINNTIEPYANNYFNSLQIYSTATTLGTVTASNSLFYYTPLLNYVGTDTFQYTVSNPNAISNVANVFIKIPEPPAPIVYNIKRTIIYNSVNNIINANITGIYSSISAPELSVHSGTVAVIGSRLFYSSPANYVGKDTFLYTATGPGGLGTGTVSIDILNSKSATVAYNVSAYILENSQNNLINLSVTNSTGTLAVTFAATHGVATVSNNFVYYTPAVNYVGFDRFGYNITNNYGTSTTATVNISVNSYQYTPVAFETTATVFENSVGNSLNPLISNSASGFIINTPPIFGTASASPFTISYTPTVGFTGIDYFYFSGYNSAGVSKPARFYVTVTPLLVPVAFNTATVVSYNTVSSVIIPKVLYPFNSTAIITPPLHGVTTTSNTLMYYTPTRGYSGTDTFTYAVGNISGISKPARVSVTVNPSGSLIITPPSGNLPRGTTGTAYTPVTIKGTNGTGPYVASLTSGNLPNGMSLLNNMLSGVPTAESYGLYNLSITVTDSSTPNPLVSTANYILDISSTQNILITSNNFNELEANCVNLITEIYGVNPALSSTVSRGDLITALNWDNIYDDTLRCFIHQRGNGTNMRFIRPNTGTYISLGQLDAMNQTLSSLTNTYFQADPSQILLDLNNVISQSTSTLITRTYSIIYDWENSAQARYFFNLGGSIRGVIYNTVTNVTIGSAFTLSNYINNVMSTATSSLAVINGVGAIRIDNGNSVIGSRVQATFQVTTSTSGTPAQMSFTATDYYSTDATGGIAAPMPLVQLTLISGQLNASPIGSFTITGNLATIVTVALSNTSPYTITLTSADLSYQSPTGMPLTVTYLNLPVVIAGNGSASLSISLQNFTAVGGKYPIVFVIKANALVNSISTLLNTISLSSQLTVNYGIVVNPSRVVGLVTAPTTFSFTITGYGGRLQQAHISPGDLAEYYIGTVVPNSNPTAPLTANFPSVRFDPSFVPNGVYTDPYGFMVESYSEEYPANGGYVQFKLDTSELIINSRDTNLGSWISACDNPNAVMGFSYDIFHGAPTLTMGFGMIPDFDTDGYLNAQYALNDLKRPRIYTQDFVSAFTLPVRYTAAGYSAHFNSFGINTRVGSPLSFLSYQNMFLRYATTLSITVSSDASGSVIISTDYAATNVVYQSPATGGDNRSSSVQYTTSSINAGTYWIKWTGGNYVSIRIRYIGGVSDNFDAWTTLDALYTSHWAEITRIELINNGTIRNYCQLPNIITHPEITSTYSSYFKNGSGTPGMFSVTNNGFGQLSINVNSVATQSGNSFTNLTINHVSDLLYYYSEISGRQSTTNLEAPFGNKQTHLFIGFNSNGTVITGVVPYPQAPPPPPPSGGGGGTNWWPVVAIFTIATAWFCFKKNTKIQMSNGTTKNISDINIGDYVYNYNGTVINQVRFIIKSKFTGNLYTPTPSIDPFGTEHHPLISNNGLPTSYNSVYVNDKFPWLGRCDQIEPADTCHVENIDVYNILVDGDGTYTVNGIGTTSVIGDGGAVITCLEQGMLDENQTLQFLKIMHDQESAKFLVWYKLNKFLTKLQSQLLFKFYAKLIKYILKKRDRHDPTITQF